MYFFMGYACVLGISYSRYWWYTELWACAVWRGQVPLVDFRYRGLKWHFESFSERKHYRPTISVGNCEKSLKSALLGNLGLLASIFTRILGLTNLGLVAYEVALALIPGGASKHCDEISAPGEK